MSSVQHVDGHQCHLVTPIAAVAAGLDERRTSYAFTTSSSPAKHLVDDSDVDGELLATGGATYRASCPPSVVSQLDLDGEPDLDTRGTRGSHATLNSTLLGNVVISKNFLRTRKIMVMHSNER